MRLPSEGSSSALPRPRGVYPASPKTQGQLAPPQIWRRMSPVQQKQVFQRLVLICRQVLNEHNQVGPEVNDEDP